jgi:6-phosphogluconolactonase (cycloisomerase 2 family)
VINSPSGTLTPVGVFPTVNPNLSFPIVTPGDNFVIAFSRSTEVLEVFAIGKSGGVPNGVLTVVGAPVPAGPAGSRPVSMAFSRRDNVLYVTNGAVGGALPPSLPPPSLAVFRLNPSTGVLTEIGTPISTNRADHGAVLHRSGRFLLQYNFSIAGFQTFAIDPTTFAPTLQPNVSTLSEPVSLFLPDFSGKYLYISHSASNSVSSYRIDAATGALTLVNTVPAGSQPLYLSPAGFQPQ